MSSMVPVRSLRDSQQLLKREIPELPKPPDDDRYRSEFGFAQCPKCKEGAELKQGCKFVYCRCKQRFCYHCSRPLTEKQHYSHFQVAAIADQGGIEVGELSLIHI